MHIGFMIQNESMLPHGKLLMQSLEKTKYESVRMMVPETEMDLVQELRAVYPDPKILVTPFVDGYRQHRVSRSKQLGVEREYGLCLSACGQKIGWLRRRRAIDCFLAADLQCV